MKLLWTEFQFSSKPENCVSQNFPTLKAMNEVINFPILKLYIQYFLIDSKNWVAFFNVVIR